MVWEILEVDLLQERVKVKLFGEDVMVKHFPASQVKVVEDRNCSNYIQGSPMLLRS